MARTKQYKPKHTTRAQDMGFMRDMIARALQTPPDARRYEMLRAAVVEMRSPVLAAEFAKVVKPEVQS